MKTIFIDRLREFLDSECQDRVNYSIEELNDNKATVKVSRFDKEIDVYFIFDDEGLKVDVMEDCYYTVDENDSSVKYFWILVSPVLFGGN